MQSPFPPSHMGIHVDTGSGIWWHCFVWNLQPKAPLLTSYFPPPPCIQWTMGLLKWKDSLFTQSWTVPWTIATISGCLQWKGCRRRGNWMNLVINVTAMSPAVRRGDTEQLSPVCSWRNWRKYSRKPITLMSM